ncbi:MAG: GntP family permease [Synergistaceae bacterium]|nr:GntP family permease [Synergistaceae bacterium]
MVGGSALVLILIVAIVLMVVMISKFKIHPFAALFTVALLMGLAAGLPMAQTVNKIAEGFGNTCRGIGIVILFGTIIGAMLEQSGAALTMADSVLRVVGPKRPALAISIIGWIVSIPVFCDSGFVILSSLSKSLAKRSGVKMATMAIALSTGLYATHTLVPPTPGPIAAAENLKANLASVILWGIVVSIPAALAGYFYAVTVGSKLKVEDVEGPTFEELKAKYLKLPSPMMAFAPIVVPLILIGLSSVLKFPTVAKALEETGQESVLYGFSKLLIFLGHPMIALFVGAIFCLFLAPKITEEVTSGWIGRGVKDGATIIMITAAGGSLGAIIEATGVGRYIGETLAQYKFGIFLPFIISAALKTAQGSSTVALVTTSTIVHPLLGSLGLASPMGAVLATLAIGCGSMVVSHANDSYFWVVSQFSNMKLNTAYKAQTIATLVEGVVGIASVWALSLANL